MDRDEMRQTRDDLRQIGAFLQDTAHEMRQLCHSDAPILEGDAPTSAAVRIILPIVTWSGAPQLPHAASACGAPLRAALRISVQYSV
jgi:hypothetical protein